MKLPNWIATSDREGRDQTSQAYTQWGQALLCWLVKLANLSGNYQKVQWSYDEDNLDKTDHKTMWNLKFKEANVSSCDFRTVSIF